jgi:hypothetical protein
MKDIKKIVKENLERKYRMNESFEKIFLNENQDDRFGLTIEYFGGLIDEGYDDTKLESVVVEQFDWIKKLMGTSTPSTNAPVTDKLKSAATGGAFSQFKEYLIKKFLGFVGFEGPLASAIATALSEMTVADLISVFRSKESCMTHSGTVAKAVTESLVTYIVQSSTEKDSMAYNFLRNSLSEYLSNEGYMDKLGQFICGIAYKSKGGAMAKLGF